MEKSLKVFFKKQPKSSGDLSGLTTIIKISFLLPLLISFSTSSLAQNIINITPMPVQLKQGNGNFTITRDTKIILEGSGLENTATLLNEQFKKTIGYTLIISKKAEVKNSIQLNFERMDYKFPGAYTMEINDKGIYIAGDNEAGVFYGIQSLIQLFPVAKEYSGKPVSIRQITIPQLSITDYPRFQYRGMHLDVCRHFFPVSFIKKYIDHLAAYKFNRFHWHLTDDQGWRIEIKKYPKLTTVGGYRNGTIIGNYPGTGNDSIPYGGFYTQQEIKEIVKYAADRYIEVIPEIEMPGHSSAAIAAYPQLSCFPDESSAVPANTSWAGSRNGKQVAQAWGVFEDVFCPSDYTFTFLEDVLDEVIQLFPSKYIHIGGDETPKAYWKRSAFCQQLIKDKGLKDELGLQSYFITHIEKYINSKGKRIIGWNEIMEGGLAPNATVMSWQGESGGVTAAKQGHDVIMTPGTYCYLDKSQSKHEDSLNIGGYLSVDTVYKYDPIPPSLSSAEGEHILGAQGNVWTEYISNPSKVEYMIFPRMIALSEVLWSPKEKRNWLNFQKRLPTIFAQLEKENIHFSKAYYDLQATVSPTTENDGVLWQLKSRSDSDQIYYISDMLSSDISQAGSKRYQQPILVKRSSLLSASLLHDHQTMGSISQQFLFNRSTGKKITLAIKPSDTYPGNDAFTLVDGIQNQKGLAKSSEFLGFLGNDLDATIDLGKEMTISTVTLHVLDLPGSWIYLPRSVEITYSSAGNTDDGAISKAPLYTKIVDPVKDKGTRTIIIENKQSCRYMHIVAKNFGIIPDGNPGAGNKAWLFVDEIEVN